MDKKLYDSVFKVYTTALMIHFISKSEDYSLHKFSEQVYNETFEFAHKIAERLTDLNQPVEKKDIETLNNELYDGLGELLKLINAPIGENKPTIGSDNLLRGLADTAEDLYGSARAFVDRKDNQIQTELEKNELLDNLFKNDNTEELE